MHSMIYFNPLRNEADFSFWKNKKGNKKLKNLFIDMKIPKEERSKIPIIADNEDVLCVGTYRVSEMFKVDESTKEVLKVCFKKL